MPFHLNQPELLLAIPITKKPLGVYLSIPCGLEVGLLNTIITNDEFQINWNDCFLPAIEWTPSKFEPTGISKICPRTAASQGSIQWI